MSVNTNRLVNLARRLPLDDSLLILEVIGELNQLYTKLTEMQNTINCYEAMKEGVAIRIAGLEDRIKSLKEPRL